MNGYANGYWGIGFEGGTGTGNGNYYLVANNTISKVKIGIATLPTQGGKQDYILISGNTIHDLTEYWSPGVYLMSASSNNIIEFNTISNTNRGVIIGDTSCANNDIYGNTYINLSGATLEDHGAGTKTTAPSIVAVTVISNPTGPGFITANGSAGLAGSISTSPYTFYATVGSTVSLTANSVPGYTFNKWSDGGAQTHTITVPASYTAYTATFS